VGTTAKSARRAMQIHMHEVRKNNEKKNPPTASKKKEKRRDRRSPNSIKKAQKCNERLMYETKEVEPNPKGTSNALKVLTQYNP